MEDAEYWVHFLTARCFQGEVFLMGGTSGDNANVDIVPPVHKDAWAYDGSAWRQVRLLKISALETTSSCPAVSRRVSLLLYSRDTI
jgi:hypothetical protein